MLNTIAVNNVEVGEPIGFVAVIININVNILKKLVNHKMYKMLIQVLNVNKTSKHSFTVVKPLEIKYFMVRAVKFTCSNFSRFVLAYI